MVDEFIRFCELQLELGLNSIDWNLLCWLSLLAKCLRQHHPRRWMRAQQHTHTHARTRIQCLRREELAHPHCCATHTRQIFFSVFLRSFSFIKNSAALAVYQSKSIQWSSYRCRAHDIMITAQSQWQQQCRVIWLELYCYDFHSIGPVSPSIRSEMNRADSSRKTVKNNERFSSALALTE